MSARERRDADRAALALAAQRIHGILFAGSDPPFVVRDGPFVFRSGRPDSIRTPGWTRAREVGDGEPRDRRLGPGDYIRHLRGRGWVAAPIHPDSGIVVIDIDNHVGRTLRGRIIRVAERMEERVREVALGTIAWARSLGHAPLTTRTPGRGYHVWIRTNGRSDPDIARSVRRDLHRFLTERGTPWPGEDPEDVGIGIDIFPHGGRMVRLPVGRGQSPVLDDLSLDTVCSVRTARGVRRRVLECADRVLRFLFSGDRIRLWSRPAAGRLHVERETSPSFHDVVAALERDGPGSGSMAERDAARCLAYAARASGRDEISTQRYIREVGERTLPEERVVRMVRAGRRIFRSLSNPQPEIRVAVPSRLPSLLNSIPSAFRTDAARIICLMAGGPVLTSRIDTAVPGRVPGTRRRRAAAGRKALVGLGLVARTWYVPGRRSARYRLTPAGWAVLLAAQEASLEVARIRRDLVPREIWRRVVPHLFRLGVDPSPPKRPSPHQVSSPPPTPTSQPIQNSRGPP